MSPEAVPAARRDSDAAERSRRSRWSGSDLLLLVSGLGMIVWAGLTVEHFFAANYPVSIFEGSFCDINAFFNCDSSAYSSIAAVAEVPIGWFGMMLGGLVALGALFPGPSLERTNRALTALNVAGVVALLGWSVFVLGSLCLLCTGYYLFSFLAFGVFWWRARQPLTVVGTSSCTVGSRAGRWTRPSTLHLAVFGVVTLGGAWGLRVYHDARRQAQTGSVASRVVSQFYSLPEVAWPSVISPYWTARATDDFHAAPIRVVEYGDLLCSDCAILYDQLERLKREFDGVLNIAFQFFPLEAACNDVVEKDKHPGACELSYMAAHDPAAFEAIHDEVFENLQAAKDPEWRRELAERYGVEDAADDPDTRRRVHELIRTGAEYAKTHEEYSHGIRSTPTMIINNRMVIGTLPYEQLRAIFRSLLDRHERGGVGFLESWVDEGT